MDCITTIFNTLTSGMSPVSLSFQPFIFSFLLLYPKLVSSPRWAAAGEVFLSAGSAMRCSEATGPSGVGGQAQFWLSSS